MLAFLQPTTIISKGFWDFENSWSVLKLLSGTTIFAKWYHSAIFTLLP